MPGECQTKGVVYKATITKRGLSGYNQTSKACRLCLLESYHIMFSMFSHLEQQEGDFFQLSPQKEADFDGKEAEMNPHNNFVFGPETLCWSSF